MATDSAYTRFAMKVFGEITGIILVPALLALLAAKTWEAHGGTRFEAYAVLVIAFALTAVVLVRQIKKYGREFEKLDRKKNL